MIPTVEDVLLMLQRKEISHEQAMAWMEEHITFAMEQARSEYVHAGPWIDTKERKPPHGENVLFVTSSGLWLGWRREKDGAWLDHFDDEVICTDLQATRWMPAPDVTTFISGSR